MKIVTMLNNFVFYNIAGFPLIVLVMGITSFVLLFRCKFFVDIFKLWRLHGKNPKYDKKDNEISGFAAFMSAAGATLGMGNIIGGAVAVTIGGAGSLLWIFIFGILFSAVKFTETFLGHYYRKEDHNAIITGGAFYYMQEGLKSTLLHFMAKPMALVYTFLFIFAYTFAGAFQMNQISSLVSKITNLELHTDNSQIFSAIAISVFTSIVLFGGIKRIGNISSKLVPFMVTCHLVSSGVIIAMHIDNFSNVCLMILEEAFNPKGQAGGIMFVIAYSIQRILFSAEAGTGASAIANSNSQKTPIQQGMIVAMEPCLVATMMIVSGLAILLTNSHQMSLEGIHLVNHAFAKAGKFIEIAFWINISLFGLTSIISNGYYIEKGWYYLTGGINPAYIRLIYILICIAFSSATFGLIMPIADSCFFLCILINAVALIALSGKVNILAKTAAS